MSAAPKRTVELPSEQAAYVDRLVAAGAYASPSDVIDAGLLALQDRDAAVEGWLREKVVPVALAMKADPDRAIPGERVLDTIRALHASRLKSADAP